MNFVAPYLSIFTHSYFFSYGARKVYVEVEEEAPKDEIEIEVEAHSAVLNGWRKYLEVEWFLARDYWSVIGAQNQNQNTKLCFPVNYRETL
ncbi:hypothetical protein KY284_031810 [Solanum tuberosum]|nr:hypothetical protein KY284_031810 [Solanum tuberosum]